MAKIHVTKTFMPPIEEYQTYLEKIWQSGQITNQGPLLKEFEQKAQNYLNVDNFHFVANGTIALQVALRALGITDGEVITTPFSYVATTSAILWEHCEPVFVDIDPHTLCIDPKKIEAAVTEKTKAIMPVHVFGYPCDVKAIDEIAKKHNIPVIYDAAHTFGVMYKGKSLLSYGDIATCSFHATKLFHTIEGGCICVQDKTLSDNIDLIKRFGHYGDDHRMLGINAKASEFNAAMGLCNLPYVPGLINKRKAVSELYDELLANTFERPQLPNDTIYNFGYYPILTKNEEQLNDILTKLAKKDIYPRRYFYPSLNTLPYLDSQQSCPVSEDVATRILCLPLYADLAHEDVHKICEVLLNA